MEAAGEYLHVERAGIHPQPLDGRIAALAAWQEGVVSGLQLSELGLGRGAIQWRLSTGRLHRVFPGAFALVPRSGRRGLMIAAQLSTQPSFASHRTAAEHFGFLEPIPGPVHVVVAHGRALRRRGIVVHRTRRLPLVERWERGPLRLTSPARTLVDLAGRLSAGELTRAFDESQRLRVVSAGAVIRACRSSAARPGTGLLKNLALDRLPLSEARSRTEALFLRFCRDHDLPIPAVNVPLLGYEVDALWEDSRLVVELDSGYHDSPSARDSDARRDARLGVAGYHIHRLRRRRLASEADRVEEELRDLLGRLGREQRPS